MNILLLLILLCIGVQAKKWNYNCSIFSMKFNEGKRYDVNRNAFTTCSKSCRTLMKRDKKNGALTIWGDCGMMHSFNLPSGSYCARYVGNEAVHCDCAADNCNFPITDAQAASMESEFKRRQDMLIGTIKCKAFEFIYDWRENERKIVSYTKPKTDISCPGSFCHNWMVEHSEFETAIHGGCGKLLTDSGKCEQFGNTHVECACTLENCNDIKDADTAELFHDEWNESFPPGPYPRSGKEYN